MGRIYPYKNGFAIYEKNERITKKIPTLLEAKKVNLAIRQIKQFSKRKTGGLK